MSDTVCITTLVENSVHARGLRAEHGLAFHVQAGQRGLLFDTGQSDLLLANATALGVDLSQVEAIVLRWATAVFKLLEIREIQPGQDNRYQASTEAINLFLQSLAIDLEAQQAATATAIHEAHEYIHGLLNGEDAEYFGDLDEPGCRIPWDFHRKHSEHYGNALTPAPYYNWLLDACHIQPITMPDPPPAWLQWFPTDIQPRVWAATQADKPPPQEAIGFQFLQKQARDDHRSWATISAGFRKSDQVIHFREL